LPAAFEQTDLMVAAGERRKSCLPDQIAPGRHDRLHMKQLDGLRRALDLPHAEAGTQKSTTKQPLSRLCANDLAWSSDLPEPGRHVPCFSHQRNPVLLGFDDGRPSVDSNMRVHVQFVFPAKLSLELLHSTKDPQTCLGGPLGTILVSDGISKARHQTLLA